MKEEKEAEEARIKAEQEAKEAELAKAESDKKAIEAELAKAESDKKAKEAELAKLAIIAAAAAKAKEKQEKIDAEAKAKEEQEKQAKLEERRAKAALAKQAKLEAEAKAIEEQEKLEKQAKRDARKKAKEEKEALMKAEALAASESDDYEKAKGLMQDYIKSAFDSKVSVDDAHKLVSDKMAKSFVIVRKTTLAIEGKIGEINISVINNNFNSNDEVTLDSLKAKKLMPKNIGRIKVLGGGKIDKPMHIVADEFSLKAIKMIILVGGSTTVIRK